MSEVTAFYIAPEGRLEALSEAALSAGRSYDDGAGHFGSHFCPACGHVTEIPVSFGEKAEAYLHQHGSLAYGSKKITNIDEIELACESCGGKVIGYRKLARMIKRVDMALEEAKSYVALAIAILALRGSWIGGKGLDVDAGNAASARQVRGLLWDGLNPRLPHFGQTLPWIVSNTLPYVFFLDKAVFSEILTRFLENITKDPNMVKHVSVLAHVIALDPATMPSEHLEHFKAWLTEVIKGTSLARYHSIDSIHHRLSLFGALATALYPIDKELVEKRVSQFSSYHSVDKEADNINAKIGILKQRLKEMDTASIADVKRRLLEKNAFLSPPRMTEDLPTDGSKQGDDARRDHEEACELARKCCDGLFSIRDGDTILLVSELLKRLERMRDDKQYLGCPSCEQGTLILKDSWMA